MKNVDKNLIMDEAKLYFLLFIIHSLAEKYNMLPKKVYETLNKTDIIEKYIIGCYDVAHSMGKLAIINDIEEYLENRGIKIC